MEGEQRKLLGMPFCFAGMGIFRAWTETVYANTSIVFPIQANAFADFTAFNMITAITLVVVALGASRIAPLYGKSWPAPVAAICLIASTCCNFYSILDPGTSQYLGIPAVIAGGVGIAFLILLWSELFGCLNPLRVALYYSGGIVVGSLILWLFKGLALPWLFVCTCLVPTVSLACLKQAYSYLPDTERPHATWGSFSLPWKPIAVVALYSFSYGLCEHVFEGPLGIHSGLGCVFAGVLVYACISLRRTAFQFSALCKIALLLIVFSLVPFGDFLPRGSFISSFCALGSYTLCLIVIMIILSNLVYRYGVNALWLFGIERAVRLVSVQAGIGTRDLTSLVASPFAVDVALGVVVTLSVVFATKLLLSEKQLSSPWGAVLKETLEDDQNMPTERNRLGIKCQELAERAALTQREEEILLLLAQRKKPADIERELFVANSTVKTHVKHIYQKLDVHSRKELFNLLGIENAG